MKTIFSLPWKKNQISEQKSRNSPLNQCFGFLFPILVHAKQTNAAKVFPFQGHKHKQVLQLSQKNAVFFPRHFSMHKVFGPSSLKFQETLDFFRFFSLFALQFFL